MSRIIRHDKKAAALPVRHETIEAAIRECDVVVIPTATIVTEELLTKRRSFPL